MGSERVLDCGSKEKMVRGGMNTTRSEVLIVSPVVSCPRGLDIVGMIISGRGCRIGGKGVEKGQKGPVIIV